MLKGIKSFLLNGILLYACGIVSAQMAPDFTVTDSDGNVHHLYADYLDQGKTVMLEVFFTTCPPCNAIAPFIEPLYQDWGGGDYDVEFFDLSNKNFDTNALVSSYKANHGHTYPAAGSQGGSLAAVAPYEAGQFGPFYGTPTFIVIAPDGTVQYGINGGTMTATIAALDAAIEATGATRPTCLNTYAFDGSFCTGDSVLVHGEWYNAPGTYTDTVPGLNGDCDSLLWITITQDPLNTKTVNTSFCAGDVGVQIYGVMYNEPGSYEVIVPSITSDCDTLVTINITLDPYTTKVVNVSHNEGDSIILYGIWYMGPGTFTDTVPAMTGCDTIVTIIVTVIPDVPIDISAEGFVRTFNNAPIANAYVIASDTNGLEVARDTTDTEGKYVFTFDSVYFFTHMLSVTVSKTLNPVNGVSVLDLVALQKHLLGLVALNSTEKLFAADVNQSGMLSVLDILYMRRLLLGFETGFTTPETWLFFHQSVNLGAPGPQPPILEPADPVFLQNIRNGTQSSIFRGVKLGDMNNSANPLN